MAENTERKQRKKRPPTKKSKAKEKHGQGSVLTLRIKKTLAPHVMELLSTKSPEELEKKYGVEVPRDLPWPDILGKNYSTRAAVILESIARRSAKKNL